MTTNRAPDKGALATVLQFVFLFGLRPVAQAQTAEPNPAAGEIYPAALQPEVMSCNRW
jgi:hypothetical protein